MGSHGSSPRIEAVRDGFRVESVRWLEAATAGNSDWIDWSTRVVARTLGAPMAFVSLVDDVSERIRSSTGGIPGVDARKAIPLSHSICRHVVASGAAVSFGNAAEDRRWRDHPAIRDFGVRAYVGVPLRAHRGAVVGALCALDVRPRQWDLTHRSTLTDVAAAVSQLAELRGTLHWRDRAVGMLAHDAKTQLQTLAIAGEQIARKAERSGAAHSLGDRMRLRRALRRARMMLDEVLDAAMWAAGAMTLHPERVDLVRLVRDAVEDHQARTRNHSIRVEIAAAPVVGSWDESRIARVVDNLLSNAVKYSPAGGEIVIRVAVRARGGEVETVLTVIDHGIGIPDDELPHVFEPFYRGRDAGRTAIGAGLGLASAREIVQLHGGTIHAEKTPGGGTTMIVELPLEPPEPERTQGSGPRPAVLPRSI